MGPALLCCGEIRIDRRVVADDDAGERRWIENHLQRVGIFMHTEKQQPRLLGKKSPHAVETPTRLVGMHQRRMGQQRTQRLELVLPMPRQAVQQGIGLRLVQPQILEEVQQGADLVEGQTDDIDEKGHLQDEFDAEFTAAQDPGNPSIAVIGAAMDVVSDQHRSAIFQSPHGTDVRCSAVAWVNAFGENVFVPARLGDFCRAAKAAASAVFLPRRFLGVAAGLLPLFFGAQGKWLFDLSRDCRCGPADLFLKFFDLSLEFFDSLICRLELALRGGDEVDQAIDVDSPLAYILSELLDGVHADTLANRPSRSCASCHKIHERHLPPGRSLSEIVRLVLESLRLYLPCFTLRTVVTEVRRWLEAGRSCFAELMEKLKLPPAEHCVLDQVFPSPGG